MHPHPDPLPVGEGRGEGVWVRVSPQLLREGKDLVPIAGPTLSQPVQLASLLDVGLKSKPDDSALVSLERSWFWRELDEASSRLATQYLAVGLKLGDRVATLLSNRGALLIHYLECFKTGLVARPAQIST